jgi:hypothetical protein
LRFEGSEVGVVKKIIPVPSTPPRSQLREK